LNSSQVGDETAKQRLTSLPGTNESSGEKDSLLEPVGISKYLTQRELVNICSTQPQKNGEFFDYNRTDLDCSDDESHGDDDDGWHLSQEMIDSMTESSWLKSELSDIGLQHLIKGITAKSSRVSHVHRINQKKRRNASNVVTCARDSSVLKTEQESTLLGYKESYPKFQQFIDKLLVLTNILERQHLNDADSITPMMEWLNRDNLPTEKTTNYEYHNKREKSGIPQL
jgi:hypothetical protein